MLPAVIKFYREEQNMHEFEKWQKEKAQGEMFYEKMQHALAAAETK